MSLNSQWVYAKKTNGNIAIVQYLGDENVIDLNAIEFGGVVETIGGYSFKDCISVKYAKIGDGIQTINDYTFSNCNNLTKISFGYNVTTINQYSFTQEKDICSVGIHNDNLIIKYYNGREIIFDKFLYDQVLNMRPFIKDEDISYVHAINQTELLVVYKDGRRVVYDTFYNGERGDYHDELTDEQEKRAFGLRLQRIMDKKWISQGELAEMVGTSQQVISLYVKGQRSPNLLMAKKIATVLGCKVDDLLYRRF